MGMTKICARGMAWWVRGALALATGACGVDGPGSAGALAEDELPREEEARSQAARRIASLFDSVEVVAIGEPHRNVELHSLLQELVADDSLVARVGVIVVEFGNAHYQDVLDRFAAGAEVHEDSVAQVWRTTTQIHGVWDAPMYEEFFHAVRRSNAGRPPSERLRVLAGDPPLDWSAIQTGEALRSVTEHRATHFTQVVLNQIEADIGGVLAVIGGAHLDLARTGTVGAMIQDAAPGTLFTVQPIIADTALTLWEPRLDTLVAPALIPTRGSWFGSMDGAILAGGGRRMVRRDGVWVEEPAPLTGRGPIHDMTDALLYLGPARSLTYERPLASLANDTAYCDAYRARWSLVSVPPERSHPCWRGGS
jgi:hypothetical protein